MFEPNGVGGPRKIPPHIFLTSNLEQLTIYRKFREVTGVRFSSLIHMENNKYKAILFPNDLETVISNNTTQLLKDAGINSIVPATMTCQRTLMVRNIDSIEHDQPEPIILATIQERNNVKVEEIIKIPTKARLLKIRFASSTDSDKIKNDGLILDYTKISPYNISQETPTIPPRICKKCYKINEHTTQQCESEKLICSLCATEGHRFDSCKADIRRCVNCQGEHCALALSCPAIKKITKEMKIQSRNTYYSANPRNHSSYAMAAGSQQTTTTTTNSQQQNKQDCTIQMMTLYSQILADCKKSEPTITNLREHQMELNIVHKHLNWPLLDFPEALLAKYSPAPLIQQHNQGEEEMDFDAIRQKRARNTANDLSPDPCPKKHHQSQETTTPLSSQPTTSSNNNVPVTETPHQRETSQTRQSKQSQINNTPIKINISDPQAINNAIARHIMPAPTPQYRGRSQSIKSKHRHPHPSQ